MTRTRIPPNGRVLSALYYSCYLLATIRCSDSKPLSWSRPYKYPKPQPHHILNHPQASLSRPATLKPLRMLRETKSHLLAALTTAQLAGLEPEAELPVAPVTTIRSWSGLPCGDALWAHRHRTAESLLAKASETEQMSPMFTCICPAILDTEAE